MYLLVSFLIASRYYKLADCAHNQTVPTSLLTDNNNRLIFLWITSDTGPAAFAEVTTCK